MAAISRLQSFAVMVSPVPCARKRALATLVSVLPRIRLEGYAGVMHNWPHRRPGLGRVTSRGLRVGLWALGLWVGTLSVTAGAVAAQEETDTEAVRRAKEYVRDVIALGKFVDAYSKGTVTLGKDGLPDHKAIAEVARVLAKVARWNNLEAAKLLFEVATIPVAPPKNADPTRGEADLYANLRVWRVRGFARNHVTKMDGEGIEDWLLTLAQEKATVDELRDVSTAAGAALRILGNRKSDKATRILLRATKHMKPMLRVQAVNALSKGATLQTVSNFIELLRDREPTVRIAALNGIGRGLGPHTDETKNTTFDKEVIKLRDQVITQVSGSLGREKVWQVRAAARECLVALRCKAIIPVLIKALKVELGRKKDPWALDIRLHKTLEGLTGQSVTMGKIDLWEAFWRKEGASFELAKADKKAAAEAVKDKGRYKKFFKIDVQSDRVLFILDFSGSMALAAKLKQAGTGVLSAAAGTTKAQLVVSEMRKMIMALPDNTVFNIIVFNDKVRIWRAQRMRPALVRLNDDARDDLLANFLDSLHPRGLTNLHAALDRAFDFGGRGLFDKHYQAGFDTIYILSDGAPTTGKVTDTDEILRLVNEVNRLRRITINAITFGNTNQMRFLGKLAKQNGGRHIHVE